MTESAGDLILWSHSIFRVDLPVKQNTSITGKTGVVTLIGNPVAHSLSPLIHNEAFRLAGLDYVYVTMPVLPDNLKQAVAGLAALGVAGSNVTVPFKQRVHDIIDETTDAAKLIGAVNTLIFTYSDEGCRIQGDNTDITGFLKSLELYKPNLENTTAVVLGSGGAARAVSYAILQDFEPESLTLVVRDDVLENVAGDTNLSVVSFDQAGDYIRNSRLIVNATPVGMDPHESDTPWEDQADFHSGQLVYDLIYAPTETRMLREAAAQGAEVKNGIDMLVGQAAASFRQWTGVDMPVDEVSKHVQSFLNR